MVCCIQYLSVRDKLVSRGCIQLFFFFALFCSHTFMYYTIFFFVKSNIWYSFGTYCEKGALLFSLCKCILLKLNTHCIQVGEAPKKGNGKYTKRHCETKTHQNGYHVDIRIVANRITFKRNGLNVQTNGKKCNPSFCVCRFESQFYNKLHSFLCSSLILLLCQNHQRNFV